MSETQQIPNDEVIVTYRGQAMAFSVTSLRWSSGGPWDEATLTIRGEAGGRFTLKVQLPCEENRWNTNGEHKS